MGNIKDYKFLESPRQNSSSVVEKSIKPLRFTSAKDKNGNAIADKADFKLTIA